VGDAAAVAVLYPIENLCEDPFGVLFFQASVRLRLQVAMQTASPHILHHQDHVLARVDDLVEPDDVGVLHLLHQLDLSLHTLPPVRIHQLVLLVDLHGHLLVGWLVQP